MADSRNLFVTAVPNIGVDVLKRSKYTPSSINQPQVVGCQMNKWYDWLVGYVPETIQRPVSVTYTE